MSRFMKTTTTNRSASGDGLIGANEDMFLQAFDSTPKLELATQKKLEAELVRVIQIISNPHADWDSRVQSIKHFRSLVNSGIADSDYFYTTTLKTLEVPFQNNICDLRSQVVRETCITIAFLSCRLQQKFSRMAEALLPSLIKLIPNSAKIVSTSALVALRFIIQSTHNSKFIPIIKYQLSTSKSKDIHRALCEIIERIVTLWPPCISERQLNDLQEAIRLGICDSDELARQYSRRAFNAFAEHFREPADRLFNSLDQQRQRMLNNLNHGGGSTLSINGYGGSTSSNLNSIGQSQPSVTTSHIVPPSASSVSTGTHVPVSSSHLLSRLKNSISTSNHNSNSLIASSTLTSNPSPSPSRIRPPTARSTSAIDVNAQRRARARAVYLNSMYIRPRVVGTVSGQTISSPPKTANLSLNSNSSQGSQISSTNSHNNSTNNDNISNIIATTANTLNSSSGSVATHHQETTHSNDDKMDGSALSKAASYLSSVIDNNTIAEAQIVTTIKYFDSSIEKYPPEVVSKLLPTIMPPLVSGMSNGAISVRKASVFAMVSIHGKVGLDKMESYLGDLTMTQRKLLEVYINKSKLNSSS